MTAASSVLASAMTEAELERAVRKILADLPQVMAYHTWNSRNSASGFPDWLFCGASGLLFRELKREAGRTTTAQEAWLSHLRGAGQDARVWRPSSLLSGEVARELAAIAGIGAAT